MAGSSTWNDDGTVNVRTAYAGTSNAGTAYTWNDGSTAYVRTADSGTAGTTGSVCSDAAAKYERHGTVWNGTSKRGH